MNAPGNDELDGVIRSALTSRATQITESSLRPIDAFGLVQPISVRQPLADDADGPADSSVHLRPWLRPLLAAAAVAAVAVATVLTVHAVGDGRRSPIGGVASHPVLPVAPATSSGTASRPSPTAASPHTSARTTGTPATSSPPATSRPGSATPPAPEFQLGYQPLWPFADYAEAEAWRVAASGSGVQPWHADARQTALAFTRGYLGFTELDRVVSVRVDRLGAHVGVGYSNPNGVANTAAILHLVRFGSAADAPWEVVGSDDTTLSLERPAYGSQVRTSLLAGGHISGVDENIRIQLRQLDDAGNSGAAVLATVPAGGTNSPWSSGLIQLRGRNGVLTIVASTGGHLQAVERFAIQGVHT